MTRRSVVERVVRYFRPPAIETAAELRSLIADEATHIAQKVPIDYCRARSLMFSEQLFSEDAFNTAMKRCTAESRAAVAGDLLIVTEGMLRDRAGLRSVLLGERLAAWFDAILTAYPLPEHRTAEGWDDVRAAFVERFGEARAAAPRKPADVARFGAKRMFETLPLHRRFTAVDADAILATVQLRVGLFATTLRERVRTELVIAELTG